MSNFRAFMSDDEEEFEQKLAEVSKPKPKSKAPVKAPAVVPATTPAAVATPGPKGPRRGPKPKPNVMEPSAVADNADQKHERPARGRGGYKGPRSGDRDDRGKRFFDRHSGAPGSGKDPKKHGAGGHNWGQPLNTNVAIDAAEAEALAPVGAPAEKKIEEVPAVGEGEPARVETPKEGEAPEGEVAPEEPKEPEVPTYTFEEFLAKKAEKRAGLGFENLRESKIEEVKEGRAYTKKDKAVVNDEEVFIALGEKKAAEERKKNQKGKQVLTDIGFRVKDPERPGSFRGGREGAPRGRGGFRGGARGGRGGFRGGRGGASSAQVRVDDQQNFPELGA